MRWIVLLLLCCLVGLRGAARPLFETHVSTRRVTCFGAQLVGTTGGLRLLGPGQAVALPGVAVRGIDGQWLATDRGLYHGLEKVDGQPATAVLETPQGLVSGHPEGRVRWRTPSSSKELRCPTSSPIHSLAWDGTHLWAAASNGLWRLDDPSKPRRLSVHPVAGTLTALVGRPGLLVAGTPAGVFVGRGGDWRPLPGVQNVSALALGESGRLWIGTSNQGVWQADLERGVERRLEGPAAVTALRWDGQQLMVGTPEGAFVDGQPLYSTFGEIQDNHITALACSDRVVWAGTFQAGLCCFKGGLWSRVSDLPSEWVNGLAFFSESVWVRFSDGTLQRSLGAGFKPVGKSQGLSKDWTSALAPGWVGTYSGFAQLCGQRWQNFAPKPSLQGMTVTGLTTRGSEVWLGTQSGLFCYQIGQGGKCDQFLAQLSDSWVTAVATYQGRICAGTFRGGLCVEQGGQWTTYRADRSALPSDRIHCMLATPAGLWLGTPEGLVWTDLQQWKCFTLEQGLPSNTIWALAERGDELWIGTDCGLAQARQSELLRGPLRPRGE